MIKSKRLLSAVFTGLIFFTTGCTATNVNPTVSNSKDNATSQAQIVINNMGGDDNQNTINNTEVDPDDDTNVVSTDNTDPSENNKPTQESKYILPPMVNQFHAIDGDKVYFRIYDTDDFLNSVYPYFRQYYRIDEENGNPRTIKVMNLNDGSLEDAVTDDPGSGNLFAAGGKLFTQQHWGISGSNEHQLYYYDLENNYKYEILEGYGSTIGSFGNYLFADEKIMDEEYGYNHYYPCIIDATNLEKIGNFPGTFIAADEDGVYSYEYEYEIDKGMNDESNEFYVYMTDYNGNVFTLVKFDYEDFEDMYFDWEAPQITCFQCLDKEIIFNVGYYAGTGHFYNGGFVYLAAKDGKSGQKICDTVSEGEFLAIEDGNSLNVSVYQWSDHDEDWVPSWYNVRGEEQIIASYHSQEFLKPYTYYSDTMMPDYGEGNEIMHGGETVIYFGGEEEYYKLISLEDFEDYGFKYGYEENDLYADTNLTEIYNVEYAGDMLFYTIGVLERNPENDAGWRYAYDHGRTVDFVKDLKTGEVQILAEY